MMNYYIEELPIRRALISVPKIEKIIIVPIFLKKIPLVFILKPDSKIIIGNKKSVNI